jgi:transcriptional regulator with GAF, ATPase, and Fis domain
MPKIQLRDVCDQLSAAADVEGVIEALLSFLRASQGDWHPSLAQVDTTREVITKVWQRERGRLERRDLVVPVDQLPARLVRKFFRPSAFFNATERRSLLSRVFRTTPVYEPDRFEAAQVRPLVAPVAWHSCIIVPLADQDDLLGLLVLVSPRRNAFPSQAVEAVLAVRTMAAVAIARRMHIDSRVVPEIRAAEEQSRRAQGAFEERVNQLEGEANALTEDNRAKTEKIELLSRELDRLQHTAHGERAELEVLRQQIRALEEQGEAAGQHLHDAFSQLAITQQRLHDHHETMEFLRGVFEAARGEHDAALLSRSLVQRFCEAFDVDRCSLMRVDDQHLQIAAHRGMDPTMAGNVRLPLGQGVAGWVARHRKPVLVRKTGDSSPVRATGVDHYNSDSFVSVPLVHRNRLLGVLNLSNKRDGKAFDETDLDRAMMASAVLSLAMGVREAENEGASVAVPVALADDTVNTDPPVIPAKSAPESLTPMSSERPQDYPFEMRG